MRGSPAIERQMLQRRLEQERRAKINECVAWFGLDRRITADRRATTAKLVDWKTRFDKARSVA